MPAGLGSYFVSAMNYDEMQAASSGLYTLNSVVPTSRKVVGLWMLGGGYRSGPKVLKASYSFRDARLWCWSIPSDSTKVLSRSLTTRAALAHGTG